MKIKMLTVAVILSVAAVTGNAADPIETKNAIINNAENMIQIKKYWTEDRLKNAVPLPLPKVGDEKLEELIRGEQRSDQHDESKEIQSAEGVGKKALAPGVPVRANVSERPFWNGGKVYFTLPDGTDGSCTAQFIGQNNILLTAGHCVRSEVTGKFYKNFMFIRAYEDNKGQQKVGWTCASAWYMLAVPPYNYKWDYAFIHTDTKSSAEWLRLTTTPYVPVTAIGYPRNYEDAKYMYKVDGNRAPSFLRSGIVKMEGNPMKGGSSGGAWIARLNTTHDVGNYAVGLNSHGHPAMPDTMWGPLFDSGVTDLYKKTINCTE